MNDRIDNTIDFVEFPIADEKTLLEAKQFFSGVFGWNYKDWGDNYADTKNSGVNSGLNADTTTNSKQPLVVIYTKNLLQAKQGVLEFGGKVSLDIFEFPGGKRFHFITPFGVELAVWSDQD